MAASRKNSQSSKSKPAANGKTADQTDHTRQQNNQTRLSTPQVKEAKTASKSPHSGVARSTASRTVPQEPAKPASMTKVPKLSSVASRRAALLHRDGDKKKLARPKKLKSSQKLSKTSKPDNLTLEEWQFQLRRQFGREQNFELTNVGEHSVFSEFLVKNPASGNTYRNAIRGLNLGDNYCSCPDFATNELGTCKHIEFTLAKLSRKRQNKAELKEGYHPPYSEVYVQYGSRRSVRFRPGTQCPDKLRLLAMKYFDDAGELRAEVFATFEKFLEQSYEIDTDLRCYEDALALIANVRDSKARLTALEKAFPAGIRSAAFDGLLKCNLYDYQREGVLFAVRAGRSVIADEMGLGKTLQAIATAEILARHMGVERVLIICPTSLKYQWEREIQKFTDRTAVVISGLAGNRRDQFQNSTFFKILNYDTVHTDLELIKRWAPDLVILDEAQRIKNWSTRVARSVKQVGSPYAVVLTGTPLENRLEELVSIVQFIDQQRLGPTYRLLHNHQDRDEHGKVVGYRNLHQIGETLKPILIRRQKKEVALQLPPRLDKNFFVPMTQMQLDLHHENLQTVSQIVTKWRRFGFLNETDQRRLMIALQNMRMACDSSYLLNQETDHGIKADEVVTLLDETIETTGNKVVVFSQWMRMLSLITRRLSGRTWEHVVFHGRIESSKRKDLVQRFREDPNCRVFFATDAGGVGLNLQHANIVVNMDLPWNPAILEQRIGRVYRLGQTQPVSVINYVSQGTIEEGMLGVIAFKKNLFAGVLDGGENNVFMGGSKLKKFMETVDKITGSIPPAVTEETVASTSARQTDKSDERPASIGSSASPLDARDDLSLVDSIQTSSNATSDGSMRSSHNSATEATIDPLANLLQQGLALLQELTAAASSTRSTPGSTFSNRDSRIRIDQDVETGKSYLRLQMPEPEVLDGALRAFGKLFESLRGQ